MNYIAEINAFEQWCENNYLPATSQLLWYRLMMLCNRCGWAEWVTVDSLRLMALVQVQRKQTIYEIRDKLIESGLVEYRKGKKGSPGQFKMISLANSVSFSVPNTAPNKGICHFYKIGAIGRKDRK